MVRSCRIVHIISRRLLILHVRSGLLRVLLEYGSFIKAKTDATAFLDSIHASGIKVMFVELMLVEDVGDNVWRVAYKACWGAPYFL
jgi:hypothetical protein